MRSTARGRRRRSSAISAWHDAAREGLFAKGGIPRNLRGARWAATFLKRHRAETVLSFPPQFAQSAMIALLAR